MTHAESRPWGTFEVLSDDESHKVKRIIVAPGARLSYQRHEHRSEHWFVVSGEGCVTRDDEVLEVAVGAAVDIPARSAHRLENRGTEPLVIIEIQHGTYFGEDDIERLSDDYGRAGVTS